MNKLFTLIALSLFFVSGSIIAQEEKEDEQKLDQRVILEKGKDGLELRVETYDSIPANTKDTTIITFDKSTIYIVSENQDCEPDSLDFESSDKERKRSLTHWAGVDLGINGLLNADGEVDLGDDLEYLELDNPLQSRTLSINFWEQKLRLAQDYVGITTGAGIQWNSYKFKNDYTLFSSKDTLSAFLDTTINIQKNKLRTAWLNVPLLLEFNTSLNDERSLHVSAGVVGGLHLGTMYKQKFELDGVKNKNKSKNNFNVAPYKLEAMARLGYGSFNLFASYQLTELFDKGHGPELYPFTLGITLFAFD